MLKTGTALVIAALALAACGDGDDDDNTTHVPDAAPLMPSVSAVIPSSAFLGREVTVTISGYATGWDDDTTVDFGEGVTVEDVHPASATGLVATVTVAEGADVGARDVTVTDGDSTVTYAGAFLVEAPISVAGLQGTIAQGSIALGTIRSRDLASPFEADDLTLQAEADGVFVQVSGNPGIFSTGFVVFIDVMAATGQTALSVLSGADEDAVSSVAPAGLDVAARSPTMLTVDTDASFSILKPLESRLFSLTPTSGKLVTVRATPDMAPDASPGIAILPASGSWIDQVNGSFEPVAKFVADGSQYYAVYLETADATGYMATVSYSEIDPPETEPDNNTCAGAQVVSLPYSQDNLTLADRADVDWFQVNSGPDAAGKVLRVATAPGGAQTDTVLEVYEADCVTSFAGPSSDLEFHETLTTGPVQASTVYNVRVSHSEFQGPGGEYVLEISLEDSP